MVNQTVLGYFCLSLVVFIWVGSGYLIQWIFSSRDSTNGYHNNPVAMTVISVGLCSLLLLLPTNQTSHKSTPLLSKKKLEENYFKLDLHSFVLGFVWLMAQLTYNVSLKHITVSTSSSISALSSFFTYMFSLYLLKGYKVDKLAVSGIVFSMIGIHMLVADSSTDNSLPVIGLVLAVSSCALYGLFSVLLKRLTRESDSVTSLFGRLGTVAILVGIPILCIADLVQFEIFHLPSFTCFLAICVNAIFGSVLSDVLLAKSIMLLTPIVVSVGLTFTIPVSMMIERTQVLAARTAIGYILVVLALVLVGSYKPETS